MDLKTYTDDPERRAMLLAAVGIHPQYLYQIASGRRKASALLAGQIADATGGTVTRQDLRPDVFGPPPAADRAA